jgi:hypothetical protein
MFNVEELYLAFVNTINKSNSCKVNRWYLGAWRNFTIFDGVAYCLVDNDIHVITYPKLDDLSTKQWNEIHKAVYTVYSSFLHKLTIKDVFETKGKLTHKLSLLPKKIRKHEFV